MNSSDLTRALGPVTAEFERLGVRYCVGGSVASSVRGASRSTLDVDLSEKIQVDQAQQLVSSLSTAFYVSESAVLDAIRRRGTFNLIHLETGYKVDDFVSKDRPFDRSVQDRATLTSVGDIEPLMARVATVEDIILLKLEWFRLGKEQSERQWDDVTRLVKFHNARLDRPYLDHWATELAVADLKERLFNQVGL